MLREWGIGAGKREGGEPEKKRGADPEPGVEAPSCGCGCDKQPMSRIIDRWAGRHLPN